VGEKIHNHWRSSRARRADCWCFKELNRFNQIGVFFTRAEAEQWL